MATDRPRLTIAAVPATVQDAMATMAPMSTLPPAPLPARDARWALFLDLDGTLIEFAETPDGVHVPPTLPAQLDALAQSLDHALAIVSGRGLATVDHLLSPLQLPTAGLHGLERRDADGQIHRFAPNQRALDQARRELARFVVSHPRCLLEDKGGSLALHWRRDPDSAAAARSAMQAALAETGDDSFHLQTGHMVVELKSNAADKGAAIGAFLTEAPFDGRVPVFVGDDDTDEHGFRVVRERGGLGIRVGQPRPDTAAQHQLADPAAVHAWLRDLHQRLQ